MIIKNEDDCKGCEHLAWFNDRPVCERRTLYLSFIVDCDYKEENDNATK